MSARNVTRPNVSRPLLCCCRHLANMIEWSNNFWTEIWADWCVGSGHSSGVTCETDHDEVGEVDDGDGGGDEEVTCGAELLSVEQCRQREGDCPSKSAIRQDELIDVVEPHQTHVVRHCRQHHHP